METHLGLSKRWKILTVALSAMFVSGSFYGFYLAFSTTEQVGFTSGLSVVMLLMFSYTLIGALKNKFIISNYKITEVGVFRTKELLKEEIKGFRIDGKNIMIVPFSATKKSFFIKDFRYFNNYEKLLIWLNRNFENITQTEYIQDRQEIKNTPDFGFTDKERIANFKRAKRIAIIYNAVSIVFFVGVYFYKDNNYLFNMIMLLYPLAGILIVFLNKGIIRIDTRHKVTYPFIAIGFLLSTFSVALKALSAYEIMDYTNFWLPFLVAGTMLFRCLFFI